MRPVSMLILLALCAACDGEQEMRGDKTPSRDDAKMASDLHTLHAGLMNYIADQRAKGGKARYPASLKDLERYVSGLDKMNQDSSTPDKVGIGYVKPADEANVPGNTMLFFETRGGKAVEGGWACYRDGTVWKGKLPGTKTDQGK